MSGHYHVKDFGASPGTSCGAEIQTAINTAGADLGSTLEFDSGEYKTEIGLINSYSGLRLVGRGSGWGGQPASSYTGRGATVIKAIAPISQLFRFQPVADSVTGMRLCNAGVTGICFDANMQASFGFVAKSFVSCDLDDLVVSDPLSYGFWFGVLPDGSMPRNGVGGAAYTEPRDSQYNRIGSMMADTRGNSAIGFYIHGDDYADFCLNQIKQMVFWHKDGTGCFIRVGDANQINMAVGYRQPGGTGTGLTFGAGSSVADYARGNSIGYAQCGPGGCLSQGGSLPAIRNKILHYDSGNGTPNPVIQSGSTLEWDGI